LQRLAAAPRRKTRLRRRDKFCLGPVAAEFCEPRQLLSAAVTAVSPNSGQANGGATINIMGSGFTGVTGVMFGTVAASSYTVNSASSISAVSPAHSVGQIDVVVDTASGNSPVTSADQFNYTASPPAVTGVGPSSGATGGGTSVTISGSGFSSVSSVMFGSSVATSFTVNSTSSITAIAPSHAAGVVDVTMVSSAGTSAINSADHYTFAATGPTVTGVSPGTGTGSGGTSVTITGTGFSGVTQVTFGGTNASSYTVNSSTSITAVAPAHTAGTVDIVVGTSSGNSTTGSADQYIYTAPVSPPAVTGLGTTSGTTAGGTSITIMGTNFTNVSAVSFGPIPAQSFVVNSSTSITAVTPAEAAGVVDVKVTNSAGTSGTSTADQFTFQSPAPVVSYLGITTGTTAGGTVVTIRGSNFQGANAVYFGRMAASSFTLSPIGGRAFWPDRSRRRSSDAEGVAPSFQCTDDVKFLRNPRAVRSSIG
jgi:hypothetical protein